MIVEIKCKLCAASKTKKGSNRLAFVSSDAETFIAYAKDLGKDEAAVLMSEFLSVPFRLMIMEDGKPIFMLEKGGDDDDEDE